MRFSVFMLYLLVASSLSMAAIINVPLDQPTIQEGIDAAVTGDTVLVADGTYDEKLNIEGRAGITVMGQSQAGTIIQPASIFFWLIPGFPAYNSRMVSIRILNSTDIVFENMTLDFDLVKANNVTGILYWDASGRLTGNLIQNMSVSDASGGYLEITCYFRAPGYTAESRAAIEISGNTFLRTGRLALVSHELVEMLITGNTFDKGGADFGYAMELGSASTATVIGNTIYGFNTSASDNSVSAGIYIENSFTQALTGITKSVHLEGNEIYDCQNGLFIGNQVDTYSGDVDIVLTATGNNIHDNLVTGVTIVDEDREYGSSVHASFQGNMVVNNGSTGYLIGSNGDGDITLELDEETITGNNTGLGLGDQGGEETGSVYSVSIFHSTIMNNSAFGVENAYSGTIVSAANNYWGTDTGPFHSLQNPGGTGNPVSDYVEFMPWCNEDFTFCQFPVLCGDANSDDDVNVADAVFLINYVFKGGPAPEPECLGDANGDGNINVADAVFLINYVFKGGPPPPDGCCP